MLNLQLQTSDLVSIPLVTISKAGKVLDVSIPSDPDFPKRLGNKFCIEEITLDSNTVSKQFFCELYMWAILS
jgi:hypothetical protein